MKDFCENQYCEDPGAEEVPVSADKDSDRKLTLCVSCEQAYNLGCWYGTMQVRQMELWLAAIADRGLIVFVQAFTDEAQAVKAVASYLRTHHGYQGPSMREKITAWLDEHDERLSVEITCQKGISALKMARARTILTRSDRYLAKKTFILLIKNRRDPNPGGPFEAWAYEGTLELSKAFPRCFGVGVNIADSLEALEQQLEDRARSNRRK